jgi:S1-C subfamily serine protease
VHTNGKVTRAYLGIVPQDVTPALARAFGQKETRGGLVGDVSANGPAAKSGLENCDIILNIDGKPVANNNDLRMTISMMAGSVAAGATAVARRNMSKNTLPRRRSVTCPVRYCRTAAGAANSAIRSRSNSFKRSRQNRSGAA